MTKGKCSAPAAAGHDWWSSDDPVVQQLAVKVCRQCPVIDACAAYADRTVLFGVVAGQMPRNHRSFGQKAAA